MAEQHTADELRQAYVQAMGLELGEQFYLLVNECSWLHWKWNEFVALYGTNAHRVELLNAAASSFFRLVQDLSWEDVLLHITRLTDPPVSAGKETLTIRRLPTLVDATMKPRAEDLIRDCLAKCAFARDWRNRHLAHRDLRLALNQPAAPMADASRANTHDAIQAIAAVLNAVAMHYGEPPMAYELTSRPGNAESLLYVLRSGVEMERQRRERLASGVATAEDWRTRPL